MENDLTPEISVSNTSDRRTVRRRALLPGWIQFFVWCFMIGGAIAPLAFITGLAGGKSSLSLFGLKTTNPLSLMGLFLVITFLFFGLIAIALWTERVWAVKLAKLGALYGIAICIFMTFIYPFFDDSEGYSFSIRLELIALIPYLNKLKAIQAEWEEDELIPEA